MRMKLLLILVSSILLGLVNACSSTSSAESSSASANNPAAEEHMDEHMGEGDDGHIMHVQAPDEFAALENPFADDHQALEAGEETFITLCATCHGEEGKGDGPGSAELDPKPADLSDQMMMSDLSDGYLFWRVTKGGAIEPFNSAMPSWEEGLTEEQRWQVIAYVRSLSEAQDHMEDMDDMHDDAHDG